MFDHDVAALSDAGRIEAETLDAELREGVRERCAYRRDSLQRLVARREKDAFRRKEPTRCLGVARVDGV